MSDHHHIERIEVPPLPEPTLADAMDNAIEIMVEIRPPTPCQVTHLPSMDYHSRYGDGRFAFRISHGATGVILQLPGIPVCLLRQPDPDLPYRVPPLYMDDVACTWAEAVTAARRILRRE